MCGPECKCHRTCLGCGAPVEAGVELSGGLTAHHGCIETYGLQKLADASKTRAGAGTPGAPWTPEDPANMDTSDALQSVLVELDRLRDDPSLTSSQRHAIRRVGVFASAGLVRLHEARAMVEHA